MQNSISCSIIADAAWWSGIINYHVVSGNSLWRFVVILIILIITLAAGRLIQYFINSYAIRREQKTESTPATIFLKCIAKPTSVATLALGLFICKAVLVFAKEDTETAVGIRPVIGQYWTKITAALAAIALAYALYKLVDLIEYYLLQWTSKTRTKLDDMLVPVIRKALRATIAIIAVLWIADGILEADITAIFLSAGVGGIAVALAAKDTIANFFGSITIFADRPFQIDDLVKVEGHYGTVEDVGFRSTRIRTFYGHLVTVPNNTIANTTIENVGRRSFIRRISNITITYDSGHEKAEKAVKIIKEILAEVPQVNKDPNTPPRVYFNEFNDCSLNIYMSYWVRPPEYWLFYEVNQKVNLEMMKRFAAEQIEFAFPTQTLYLNKQ